MYFTAILIRLLEPPRRSGTAAFAAKKHAESGYWRASRISHPIARCTRWVFPVFLVGVRGSESPQARHNVLRSLRDDRLRSAGIERYGRGLGRNPDTHFPSSPGLLAAKLGRGAVRPTAVIGWSVLLGHEREIKQRIDVEW